MKVVKKINALKARQNLGQLLEEVYYKGDEYVIERAGRPMAAVVPLWQLEKRQKRRERFFGMVEELQQKNQGTKPAVIEEDPAGDRYLECAVEGEVDYLVSGDRHLLDRGEYQGIRILSPRAFLAVLK